jgi:hypothetical protein
MDWIPLGGNPYQAYGRFEEFKDGEMNVFFDSVAWDSASKKEAIDNMNAKIDEMMAIQESFNFERGKDPKSALNVGLSNIIYDKWDDLQEENGIGSINIEKSLNSVWHLVIFVAQFPGNAEDGFKKAQKHLGEYLGDFYNRKKTVEIKIMILPEYVRAFIDAYNMRYPDWKINEELDFQRSHSKGDIIDRISDNPFRKGRLFIYKREYTDNSKKAVVYLGDRFSGSGLGIFQAVGVFFRTKNDKENFYAFYVPHLLYGSDKRLVISKDTVRPFNKEEIELYLKRVENPNNERFLEHMREVEKITGVKPFI